MEFGIVEGFFFKLKTNDIFYAKGVAHPVGSIVAYPKYVVDSGGDRIDLSGTKYRKISSVNEEYNYVVSNYAKYLKYDEFFCRNIVVVPVEDIFYIYNPIKKARDLLNIDLENFVVVDARDMVVDLIESTSVYDIGLSGSILVDLHKKDSDIDIVVYGIDNGFKIYKYLQEVVDRNSEYRRYSKDFAKYLYLRRVKETPITFEQFFIQQSRKMLEGLFRNREYFIRLVKYPWEEFSYGSYKCRKLGKSLLKLRIIDARESIYTPCRYRVEVVEIIDGVKVENVEEIYSLRGRFNEIAREDDIVEVFGTIEIVLFRNGKSYYRIYLGDENDYMIITQT